MPKKPRLGQNFLVDAEACRAIVAALGNLSQDSVLEIGPGRGAITHLLARQSPQLTLIEFDPGLAAALRQEFADRPSVDVRHADILAVDLKKLAATAGRPLVLVGNLPYYITSDILLHLVAHHAAIDRAVLMVQREVAERIAASPGSSDYGVLSATLQLFGEVELLFSLPPSAFSPPPDVYSSVVRLRVRPRLQELGVGADRFVPFIRSSFAQKRKTWSNNLRVAGYRPDAIARAFDAAGVHAAIRAEAVTLAQMAAAFHTLTDAQ